MFRAIGFAIYVFSCWLFELCKGIFNYFAFLKKRIKDSLSVKNYLILKLIIAFLALLTETIIFFVLDTKQILDEEYKILFLILIALTFLLSTYCLFKVINYYLTLKKFISENEFKEISFKEKNSFLFKSDIIELYNSLVKAYKNLNQANDLNQFINSYASFIQLEKNTKQNLPLTVVKKINKAKEKMSENVDQQIMQLVKIEYDKLNCITDSSKYINSYNVFLRGEERLISQLPLSIIEKINKAKEKVSENIDQQIMQRIRNDYNNILNLLFTKQIKFCKNINNESETLIKAINNNKNRLNVLNDKYLKEIIQNLNYIIDFTGKYKTSFYLNNSNVSFDDMDGRSFEKFCANLLIANGFVNVSITKDSGDQGVDIIAAQNGITYAVQCKRYNHKLTNKPIQEVVAGKNFYKCQKAVVMTNNYFTDGAIELAKANDVILWDRKYILQLIYFSDLEWEKLFKKLQKTEDKPLS